MNGSITPRLTAGRTTIQDRGYARVHDFQPVPAAQAQFFTWIVWRSLRPLNAESQPIDVLSLLPPDDQPVDHPVRLNGMAVPLPC